MKKAKIYKGSAKEYISDVMLPSLPPIEHVIQASKNMSHYLSVGSRYRIIRKTKGFTNRGLAYMQGDKLIVPSDNEAALYVYMESFTNNAIDYAEEIDSERIPIAFAMTKDEKSQSPQLTNIGRKKREANFGNLGWKLCHIFQCSPKDSIEHLDADSRMIRLLNPMNHFPFPSPRKFKMPHDYGEDERFINLVIQTVYSQYYSEDSYKKEFREFILRSKGYFPTDVEDFQIDISHNIKKSLRQGLKDKLINENKIKEVVKNNKLLSGERQNVVSKNFIIKKNWLGKGLVVQVPRLGIQYDHDKLVSRNYKILGPGGRANKSWEKYGCYTSSRSYPLWADDSIEPLAHL